MCIDALEKACASWDKGTAINRPRTDLVMPSPSEAGVYAFKSDGSGPLRSAHRRHAHNFGYNSLKSARKPYDQNQSSRHARRLRRRGRQRHRAPTANGLVFGERLSLGEKILNRQSNPKERKKNFNRKLGRSDTRLIPVQLIPAGSLIQSKASYRD